MKPHTTANEFAPANTQTAHAAVNTATTRPATFAKRFALPGLAALSLLATGVLAAIETQKETTLSTASEAMAGDACFKLETITIDDYVKLSMSKKKKDKKEYAKWKEYFCTEIEMGKECGGKRNVRYQECLGRKGDLQRCADGNDFSECKKITQHCRPGTKILSCHPMVLVSRIDLPYGIWLPDPRPGKITPCSPRLRGVGSGECKKTK
jgi:hypothetical protein